MLVFKTHLRRMFRFSTNFYPQTCHVQAILMYSNQLTCQLMYTYILYNNVPGTNYCYLLNQHCFVTVKDIEQCYKSELIIRVFVLLQQCSNTCITFLV